MPHSKGVHDHFHIIINVAAPHSQHIAERSVKPC